MLAPKFCLLTASIPTFSSLHLEADSTKAVSGAMVWSICRIWNLVVHGLHPGFTVVRLRGMLLAVVVYYPIWCWIFKIHYQYKKLNFKKERKKDLVPLGLHFQMATIGGSWVTPARWTWHGPHYSRSTTGSPCSFSLPVWLLKAFEAMTSCCFKMITWACERLPRIHRAANLNLHCPKWQPLTTGGYWAPAMWPVWPRTDFLNLIFDKCLKWWHNVLLDSAGLDQEKW